MEGVTADNSCVSQYGKIVVLKRDGRDSASFELSDIEYTFGRASNCDIRIQLGTIGEEHCRLRRNPEGHIVLQNIDEKGTGLNDLLLTGCDEAILRPGDVIKVVERSFRYENPHYATRFPEEKAAPSTPVKNPELSARGTPLKAVLDEIVPGSAQKTPRRLLQQQQQQAEATPKTPATPCHSKLAQSPVVRSTPRATVPGSPTVVDCEIVASPKFARGELYEYKQNEETAEVEMTPIRQHTGVVEAKVDEEGMMMADGEDGVLPLTVESAEVEPAEATPEAFPEKTADLAEPTPEVATAVTEVDPVPEQTEEVVEAVTEVVESVTEVVESVTETVESVTEVVGLGAETVEPVTEVVEPAAETVADVMVEETASVEMAVADEPAVAETSVTETVEITIADAADVNDVELTAEDKLAEQPAEMEEATVVETTMDGVAVPGEAVPEEVTCSMDVEPTENLTGELTDAMENGPTENLIDLNEPEDLAAAVVDESAPVESVQVVVEEAVAAETTEVAPVEVAVANEDIAEPIQEPAVEELAVAATEEIAQAEVTVVPVESAEPAVEATETTESPVESNEMVEVERPSTPARMSAADLAVIEVLQQEDAMTPRRSSRCASPYAQARLSSRTPSKRTSATSTPLKEATEEVRYVLAVTPAEAGVEVSSSAKKTGRKAKTPATGRRGARSDAPDASPSLRPGQSLSETDDLMVDSENQTPADDNVSIPTGKRRQEVNTPRRKSARTQH